MSGGAGIIDAYSAISNAWATSSAEERNARMSRYMAGVAYKAALDNTRQVARENYLRLGEMRASVGASGGTGGSFLDVLADTAAQGELQKQKTLEYGLSKAAIIFAGGSASEAAAAGAERGGYLKAAGSLIGGSYGSVRAAGSNTTANSGAGSELNFSGS